MDSEEGVAEAEGETLALSRMDRYITFESNIFVLIIMLYRQYQGILIKDVSKRD